MLALNVLDMRWRSCSCHAFVVWTVEAVQRSCLNLVVCRLALYLLHFLYLLAVMVVSVNCLDLNYIRFLSARDDQKQYHLK